MSIVEDVFSIITKCSGYFVSSKNKVKSIQVAALSTAEALLSLLNNKLVSDIKDIKERFKKQIDAETRLKEAEAQKRVSDAIVAANEANLPKRKDAFAKAELRIKEAQAAKTEAEAKAIELKAKGQYEKDMADTTARLIEAQSKIVQAGGSVFFKKTNLEKLYDNCQKKLEQFGKEGFVDFESIEIRAIEKMLKVDYAGFGLDKKRRPLIYIDNEYKLQGNVVCDKVTGLTWQQSGSGFLVEFDDAKTYIARLNQENFAGCRDWRLPTLEEAKSLLEPIRNIHSVLYIDPIFDNKLIRIWTSDSCRVLDGSTFGLWSVNFDYGDCGIHFNTIHSLGYSVRAVREGNH